jgi:hypothetical protein
MPIFFIDITTPSIGLPLPGSPICHPAYSRIFGDCSRKSGIRLVEELTRTGPGGLNWTWMRRDGSR